MTMMCLMLATIPKLAQASFESSNHNVTFTSKSTTNQINATGSAITRTSTRTFFPIEELLQSNFRPAAVVADDSFARPPDALPPSNVLNGKLKLANTAFLRYTVVRDDFGYMWYASRQRLPPQFEVEYTMVGDAVVPLARGLVITGDVVYNLVFTPGVAWDEKAGTDNGYSRASVPFALSERNANCILNGLMLFGFKSNGAVTNARFQITQETCMYFKVNYWGQLPATFAVSPQSDSRFVAARAVFAKEVEARMPALPLSALASKGVDPTVYGQKLTQEHVTTRGVVFDGVSYEGSCITRTGDYGGHCSQMVVPSYSTCKSIFAGLALMRLAQLFGQSVMSELIRDYVPEAASASGDWTRVTFRDALDMMTGNYQSSDYQVDENQNMGDFFEAETYKGKLAAAFKFRSQVPPATKHIYHTTDTFIVTAAMQKYLEGQGQEQAKPMDIWQLVVDDILVPLRVQSGAWTSLRTYDTIPNMAYGGYGLFFVQDDVAKITNFIQNGGAINGQQIVSFEALQGAMQKLDNDRGLSANNPNLPLRYNYAFWAQEYAGSTFGCAAPTARIPYLSGYGGIRMVLMPNGLTFYYFSDNGEFEMDAELQESRKVGSFC